MPKYWEPFRDLSKPFGLLALSWDKQNKSVPEIKANCYTSFSFESSKPDYHKCLLMSLLFHCSAFDNFEDNFISALLIFILKICWHVYLFYTSFSYISFSQGTKEMNGHCDRSNDIEMSNCPRFKDACRYQSLSAQVPCPHRTVVPQHLADLFIPRYRGIAMPIQKQLFAHSIYSISLLNPCYQLGFILQYSSVLTYTNMYMLTLL